MHEVYGDLRTIVCCFAVLDVCIGYSRMCYTYLERESEIRPPPSPFAIQWSARVRHDICVPNNVADIIVILTHAYTDKFAKPFQALHASVPAFLLTRLRLNNVPDDSIGLCVASHIDDTECTA